MFYLYLVDVQSKAKVRVHIFLQKFECIIFVQKSRCIWIYLSYPMGAAGCLLLRGLNKGVPPPIPMYCIHRMHIYYSCLCSVCLDKFHPELMPFFQLSLYIFESSVFTIMAEFQVRTMWTHHVNKNFRKFHHWSYARLFFCYKFIVSSYHGGMN